MNKFFNPEFESENVIKLNFPIALAREINTLLMDSKVLGRLATVSPRWNSDIKWLSPNSLHDFKIFSKIFDALNVSKLIKDSLNLNYELILYCGFLVTRSKCNAVNYHADWHDLGLKAFTLITPLVEEGDDLGIYYKKTDSSEGIYKYKPGEAIIFGSDFIHSTMPSTSNRKIVLLSFTFGINDISFLPQISRSIGSQSNLYRLPNGDFRVRNLDKCQ
jgi:hypothetical protein